MPICDNCGSPIGFNDRNFTKGGGALCDHCCQINCVHRLVELSIDLLDRDPEEILGDLEAAPPAIHGLTIGGLLRIAYHVIRNGELDEVQTLVSRAVIDGM